MWGGPVGRSCVEQLHESRAVRMGQRVVTLHGDQRDDVAVEHGDFAPGVGLRRAVGDQGVGAGRVRFATSAPIAGLPLLPHRPAARWPGRRRTRWPQPASSNWPRTAITWRRAPCSPPRARGSAAGGRRCARSRTAERSARSPRDCARGGGAVAGVPLLGVTRVDGVPPAGAELLRRGKRLHGQPAGRGARRVHRARHRDLRSDFGGRRRGRLRGSRGGARRGGRADACLGLAAGPGRAPQRRGATAHRRRARCACRSPESPGQSKGPDARVRRSPPVHSAAGQRRRHPVDGLLEERPRRREVGAHEPGTGLARTRRRRSARRRRARGRTPAGWSPRPSSRQSSQAR